MEKKVEKLYLQTHLSVTDEVGDNLPSLTDDVIERDLKEFAAWNARRSGQPRKAKSSNCMAEIWRWEGEPGMQNDECQMLMAMLNDNDNNDNDDNKFQ